jgi:hypothetical protein
MGLERTTFCMANASSRSLLFAPVPSKALLAAASIQASERERTRANAEPCHPCHGAGRASRRTSAARLGGILRDSVNVVERRPGHARGRGFESRRSRLEKRLQIGTLCCLLGPWPIRDRAPAGRCLIGDQARSVDVLTQELLRPRLRRRYRAGRCERADLFNGQTQRESSTAASVLANSGG